MKNEKFICLFILVFFLFFFSKTVFAESSYVLPYPSRMPGSFAYKLYLVFEGTSKYWYFGDFGQFNYTLKMADKYLIEAKTLFEYKQYLLGYKALQKSDFYFVRIVPNIINAERKGKNILQKKEILKEASGKHIEMLEEMKGKTPSTFLWQPEKSEPTALNLERAIGQSIQLRKKNL